MLLVVFSNVPDGSNFAKFSLICWFNREFHQFFSKNFSCIFSFRDISLFFTIFHTSWSDAGDLPCVGNPSF